MKLLNETLTFVKLSYSYMQPWTLRKALRAPRAYWIYMKRVL
jgi:hypothetical protein